MRRVATLSLRLSGTRQIASMLMRAGSRREDCVTLHQSETARGRAVSAYSIAKNARKRVESQTFASIRFHSASSFEIPLPPRQPFSTHLFLKHGSFQYFSVSFLKLLFFWSFTRDILSFPRFCPPSSKRTLSYRLFSWLDSYPYFSNLFPFPAVQSRCLHYAVLTVNPFPRRFASFLFFVLLGCCFLSSSAVSEKIFDSSPCHLIFARVSPLYSYRYLLNYSYFLLLIRFLKMICHFLFVAVTCPVFYLFLRFGLCHFNPSFLRDIKRGRSLTWRQCLLASQPMCWSCGGSGSAEASRSAFKVRAASAECRALNHTLASALSAALNQHSCTPSGECSSRIRPSESRKQPRKKIVSFDLQNYSLILSAINNVYFKTFRLLPRYNEFQFSFS